jgi:hypothetical protein
MVVPYILVKGELIQSLSHCGQMTLSRLLFSGNDHWSPGASPPAQVKYMGCLQMVTQAVAWTARVSFGLSFVAIFKFNGRSSGYSPQIGLKGRRRMEKQ